MKRLSALWFSIVFAAAGLVAHSRAQDAQALRAAEAPPGAIWLDSLDLSKAAIRRGRGQRGAPAPAGAPQRGTAQPGQAAAPLPPPRAGGAPAGMRGGPPVPLKLTLAGVDYPHGVPLMVNGDMVVDLKGAATRFVSMIGIDDAAREGQGTVTFDVWVDGKHAFDSGVMKSGDAPRQVSVDLAGAKQLILSVNDAGDGTRDDLAVWGGAMLLLASGAQNRPEAVTYPAERAPAIATSRTAETRINSPRVTGATPGRWFQFLIPASGEGPLTFAAKNLPAGLSLDPKTGIISGSLKSAGRTVVDLTVTGPHRKATGQLTIVGGGRALAQTPPLGWNSWNIWGGTVTDAKVRAAADGLVSSGLAAQGYTYVNIDDAWEGPRAADGEITSNEKFPDMKALADYVHSKGLKIGIYSSPGPFTCQRVYAGSYQHEDQDAKTYAKWGVDYLKYDWCSYSQIAPNPTLEDRKKPYRIMRAALDAVDRDIVYSLCQYGAGNVWEWGSEVGGNLWRVTGDITDTWASMSGIGFAQTGHEKYAGPGHWNDTDMLVVGKVGWGRALRDTNLTPNEQITHITLWSLQAAPLLVGADLSQIDDFTVNLLGNPEVIAVNQDPLGQAAGRLRGDGRIDVWTRKLSDGTVAVGLFNRAPIAMPISVTLSELGLSGPQPVRDLWQRTDLAPARGDISTTVPRHGAMFLKVGRARR